MWKKVKYEEWRGKKKGQGEIGEGEDIVGSVKKRNKKE